MTKPRKQTAHSRNYWARRTSSLFPHVLLLLRYRHFGKPRPLSGYSARSTIRRLVRYLGWRYTPFPLTPALSLGERVNPSLPREQSTSVGFRLRNARCTLSPRERARVRGNKAPRCHSRMSLTWRARITPRCVVLRVIPDAKPPDLH